MPATGQSCPSPLGPRDTPHSAQRYARPEEDGQELRACSASPGRRHGLPQVNSTRVGSAACSGAKLENWVDSDKGSCIRSRGLTGRVNYVCDSVLFILQQTGNSFCFSLLKCPLIFHFLMDASVLKGCYLAKLAEHCAKCACNLEVLYLFLNNSIEKISHFLPRTKCKLRTKMQIFNLIFIEHKMQIS